MSHVGEVLARHAMSYIGDLISQVTHMGDRYECKHLWNSMLNMLGHDFLYSIWIYKI